MSRRFVFLAAVLAACTSVHGQGVVGTDGGWTGPVPEEFRIKRRPPFEFASKPTATRHGDNITIRKLEDTCTFCGSTRNVGAFKGKGICTRCKAQLA